MTIQIVNIDQFHQIADPNTESFLLPSDMAQSDNSLRRKHLKIALSEAVQNKLTPVQRRYIEMHYWQGLGKSEIARIQGVSCSTVTRTIAAAMETMNHYISLYIRIFDRVSRDVYDQMWEEGL